MNETRGVPSYSELRKLAAPVVPKIKSEPLCDYIFVAGWPDPLSSGLQGFFSWRPESVFPDDGGVVIKPDATAPKSKGRWHRDVEGPFSVKWFGAKGNGSADDTKAIQSAVDAATVSRRPGVYFPAGHYRISRAIELSTDDFTLSGSPGAVLVLEPASAIVGQFYAPEAILINKGLPPAEVKRITVRDIRIEVKGGSDLDDFSAGVVQVNNCTDCVVRNVHVLYTGPIPKPKNIDGIVTSQGTSGLIQNCTVDGIPKAGIYVAQGSHDVRVDCCETRNTHGPVGQAGISVTGAKRVIISNCLSHDNGGSGLFVGVAAPIGGNAGVPATSVQVLGGMFYNNGEEGVRLASAAETWPQNIQIIGVTAESNRGRGISIEAGCDILIDSPVAFANGVQGIWLQNLPTDPNVPRTTRVEITNPKVFDNCVSINVDGSGIGLRAADHVTISGGRLSRTGGNAASRQEYGVALYTGNGAKSCTNLRLLDVDGSAGQKKPLGTLDINTSFEDPQAAAASGYYRMQNDGDPEGAISAPPGSEYVDTTTGLVYRKISGTGAVGWQKL